MEREARRRELLFALISRVLTEPEMAEVARWDYHLMVASAGGDENGWYSESYKESDKRRQFGDALLQQFKLRAAAQATQEA